MKILVTLLAIITGPFFGLCVFAIMFNYSYEDSASMIISAAVANSAFGLIFGFLSHITSNLRAYISYLRCTWVFILICLGNLFGDSPIEQAWLFSLLILIGGLVPTLLAKPKGLDT